MKSTIFIKITLIALATCFWTCTGDQNISDNLEDKIKDRRLRENLGTFEIDDTLAVDYINAYIDYSDSVAANLVSNEFAPASNIGQYLVYGAKVRLAELMEVIGDAQMTPHTNDSLFIMMGIIPAKSNPSIDSTELIYVLKSGEDHSYTYFDFTVPCPNACPDWVTKDE